MNLSNNPQANTDQRIEEAMTRFLNSTRQSPAPGSEKLHMAVLKALDSSVSIEQDKFLVLSSCDRFSTTCLVVGEDFCRGGLNYKYVSIDTDTRRFDVVFSMDFSSHHPKLLFMIQALETGEVKGMGGGSAKLAHGKDGVELVLYDESSDLGPTNIAEATKRVSESGLIDKCLGHYKAV